MSEHQSISVFFPCFNEVETIPHIYTSATDVLRTLGMDYEIIFVNDGSTDDTKVVLEEIATFDSRVRSVHHTQNEGYGMSLRSGIKAATKDLVFYSDGDGQFDLNELLPIIPLLNYYDIVSCYRKNRQEGVLRTFYAWGWNTLVRTIFSIQLKDVDCAFKVYKRTIFNNMELVSTSALIDAEILTRATQQGFTVTQTGVTHYPRKHGVSTGSSGRVILHALLEVAKYHTTIKKSACV